jgi:hypothetical protein
VMQLAACMGMFDETCFKVSWLWCMYQSVYHDTVKSVLNGPFIKQNFVLNGNIFRSRDCHSISWLNGNLASAENCSGPLRFRLRQVLLYYEADTKVYISMCLHH